MLKTIDYKQQESQRQLAVMLEANLDFTAIFDLDGQLSYINKTGRKMLAFTETEDISYLNIQDIYPQWARKWILKEELQTATRQGVWSGETALLTRDGLEIPVSQVIIAHRSSTGAIEFFSTIARNITPRKNAEKALLMFAKIFENTQEGIMITDVNKNIQTVNPAFSAITGYSAEEVIGKNPNILQSGRQDEEFYNNFWRMINETDHWQGEIWNRRKNGETYPEWLSISTIRDNNGEITNYVAIFSDITTIKVAENRLIHLAKSDALTGLPNRLLFYDRLKQALVQAFRHHYIVAVMFVDLDHFKAINDNLGHRIGDFFLQAVAERLIGCVREGDTVARLGGDEFTLILMGIMDEQDVAKIAQKILSVLSEPFVLEGYKLSIGASIGISLYPFDGSDAEMLVKNADMAMYRAKKQGGSRYKFYREEET